MDRISASASRRNSSRVGAEGAGVLMDLGLSSITLGVALFGFNVGVELGQLAIVLAFISIAFALRVAPFYRWAVLRTGSVAVALIALKWFYERAFKVAPIDLWLVQAGQE